jgi:hypothetical protein
MVQQPSGLIQQVVLAPGVVAGRVQENDKVCTQPLASLVQQLLCAPGSQAGTNAQMEACQ